LSRGASVRFTMVFTTFVFMAAFNEINCRRLDNKWNIFSGFFTNWIFVSIILGTAALQGLITSVGGIAFHVVQLNWRYWLICILLAATILPFGVLNRVLIPAPDFDFVKYERPKKKKKASKSKDSDSDEETSEGKKEEGHVAEMELP